MLRKPVFNTNRAFRVHESPPSFRFPPLREGNRARRAHSVPPASRGNLKEGVFNCCFCELWLGDWYKKSVYHHRVARGSTVKLARPPYATRCWTAIDPRAYHPASRQHPKICCSSVDSCISSMPTRTCCLSGKLSGSSRIGHCPSYRACTMKLISVHLLKCTLQECCPTRRTPCLCAGWLDTA